MRFRRRFAAAGFFGLAVAIACSPAKTSAPAPAVDAALRPFLLDPTLECATGSETGFESSLQVAYRELIRSGDGAAALRSTMEMARLAEDARGELAAVKALQASSPQDPALSLRRGQLELLAGDPRVGLALIEALAAAAPGDPALQTEAARAKFAWRLLNSPEQVRSLRDKVQLTRGDFAVLLYWMVPQIRTARPGAAQIASDIVDHPSRDEIARVANLGLMSIDETLHRFSPDAPLRRPDAVSALLRLLADANPEGECRLPRSGGREGLCRAGASCGLLEDPLLCQAGSGISGSEAIEMLRRALDRLEGA